MGIKREVAKVKIARRKRKAKKHDKDVKKLGLGRNKALREAEDAIEVASALEGKRVAEAKKSAALAPIEAEKARKRKARRAEAKKALGGIDKSTKRLRRSLKKGVVSFLEPEKKARKRK